jgi:hypothetical protein
LKGLFSAAIRALETSRRDCSSEELRMPRWRVAGRRCLEYSKTQRVRAEPLGRFRKIQFSSSKLFPGKSMAAPWVGVWPLRDNFVDRQV